MTEIFAFIVGILLTSLVFCGIIITQRKDKHKGVDAYKPSEQEKRPEHDSKKELEIEYITGKVFVELVELHELTPEYNNKKKITRQLNRTIMEKLESSLSNYLVITARENIMDNSVEYKATLKIVKED